MRTAQLQDTRTTLADRLTQQLAAAILDGEIAPGTKLNEAALAARFGVSRGPLREAIRELEGLRLIVRRPHVGARVISLTHAELSEVYAIREALEGMAARLAAITMSDEAISKLHDVLNVHESAVAQSDGHAYIRQHGHLDFHLRILQGSGNTRLFKLVGEDLYQLVMLYRRQLKDHPSRPTRALTEHRAICDAIAHRDPELAEMLMRRHIRGAGNDLLKCIEESP